MAATRRGRILRQASAQHDSARKRALVLLFALLLASAQPVAAADLEPTTSAAFNRYAQLTSAKFDSENRNLSQFLWIDRLPEAKKQEAYAQLRSGQVVIERLETQDGGKPIPTPDGMIHHWIGTVFIPGATLEQTLAFMEDYDQQASYFSPNVVRSKILSHNGPDFTVEIRLHEKKVITVVLDTVDSIHYTQVDAAHAWSRSSTTRVQQVDHPGESGERLEPQGHDGGFLWAMDTYWRFEQKDGGTYVESQSVSLTRDIPTGLGWMIGSYVTSVPRESLTFMLAATRAAVLQRLHSGN